MGGRVGGGKGGKEGGIHPGMLGKYRVSKLCAGYSLLEDSSSEEQAALAKQGWRTEDQWQHSLWRRIHKGECLACHCHNNALYRYTIAIDFTQQVTWHHMISSCDAYLATAQYRQ